MTAPQNQFSEQDLIEVRDKIQKDMGTDSFSHWGLDLGKDNDLVVWPILSPDFITGIFTALATTHDTPIRFCTFYKDEIDLQHTECIGEC